MPLILLRLEGAATLIASMIGYGHLGYSWWLFGALLLVPDLSMLGYLANARVGAICYNVMHTTSAPIALVLAAFVSDDRLLASLGAIWLAHIGLDRMLGFGLKYATAFADTHLGGPGRRLEPN